MRRNAIRAAIFGAVKGVAVSLAISLFILVLMFVFGGISREDLPRSGGGLAGAAKVVAVGERSLPTTSAYWRWLYGSGLICIGIAPILAIRDSEIERMRSLSEPVRRGRCALLGLLVPFGFATVFSILVNPLSPAPTARDSMPLWQFAPLMGVCAPAIGFMTVIVVPIFLKAYREEQAKQVKP